MALKSSNKIDTNTYEVEVTVDADVFTEACKSAYLKQRKSIQIPGFRKGKATQGMVEKVYGEGAFYEEALEIVYPDAVQEAFDAAGLKVVDQPYDLEVPVMSKSEGVEMKMKVTTYPEVKLGEYKGLEAKMLDTEASDEDVENELRNMQDRNSRLVSVDDRAAEMGDTAEIDFEGFVDGVAFEGGKAENYELTIGSNQFIPGFEDQIIGHKAGEEFDVNVKFPEDYHAELAGKDATFKIKLHEIKVKEVPALDDEFVKDVSEYDTVDELKKNVKEELENKKQHEVEAEANNEVLDKLADLVTAVIPDCMIEKKMDDDVQDFAYRLQMQGLDLKTYLKYTGSDEKTFREQYKEQAEKQVKLDLALAEIIKKENLEVSDADLEEEYAQYAKAYNMDVDQIKKAIPADNIKPELLQRKAVDFVIENASFAAEKKPAAKKAAAPKAEKADEEKPAAKKTTKKAPEKKDAE